MPIARKENYDKLWDGERQDFLMKSVRIRVNEFHAAHLGRNNLKTLRRMCRQVFEC